MGETTRAYGTQSPILNQSRKISKYYLLSFLVGFVSGCSGPADDGCSTDALCHYEKGTDALLEENYAAAITSFSKAQQLDPSLDLGEQIEDLILLSESSSLDLDGIDSGGLASAEDDCSINALCQYEKGVDAMLDEDYSAAITSFNQAQQLDPSLDLDEQIEGLVTLSENSSPDSVGIESGGLAPADDDCSTDALCHYEKGLDALLEENYPAAINAFNRAQQLDPSLGLDEEIEDLIAFRTEIGPAESGTAKAESKTVLFEGSLGDQWKELSWSGGDYKKFARIQNSVLLVSVPAGNSYGNTGIRSSEPLIEFPEEDSKFATRLSLSIEPELSSAFVVALIPPNWDGIKEWGPTIFG